MVWVGAYKALAGSNKCSKAAFHISRTTAMEVPLFYNRIKWGVGPVFFRPGGHHISMTSKGQYRTLGAFSGPEVIRIAKAHVFADKPQGNQARHHQLLTASVFWRYRRAANQVDGQIERWRISCLHAVLHSARWRI